MTEHVTAAARPWTLSTEPPFALRRNGEPALLVGGQVFNSASSSPKAIADSFAHVRRVGSNVVLSPVSWALSEPVDRSLLVFEGPDASVAENFARNDPYVIEGLVRSWRVRPWRVVIGADYRGAPPG